MSDKPSESTSNLPLSRRKMLALTSGMAAGLAGCTDQNTDSTATPGQNTDGTTGSETSGTGETTTEGSTGSGELMDPSPTMTVAMLPDEINFNRYARNIEFINWQWDYLRSEYYTNDSFNWLLEDFNYDGEKNELQYTFKQNFYWQDGTQVTAEDYYNQQEIARLMDPEGSDIEEHVLKDDFTMVSKRKEPLNPVLVGVEEGRLWTRRDHNRQWLEKYQDASGESGRKKVTSELVNYKLGIDEFAEKGLSNSVWKLKEWNEQEYVFEKFEKHPFAKDIDFDQINFLVAKGGSTKQLVTKDRIDFGIGIFSPDLKGAAPDHLKTVAKTRSIQSQTLPFNYKNKHTGRRGVRRAILAALPIPAMGKRHLDNDLVHQYQSGLPSNQENKWLGSDFLGKLIPYSQKADTEQATQFMEEEGYTKESGKWVDEDGEQVSFTYTCETTSAQAAFGKELQQHLNNFGFDVELKTMESVTWYKDFLNGDQWDVTHFGHGWGNNHPLNFYNYNNHYKMRIGTGGQIETWMSEGKNHSPINGRPIVATVPETVGETTTDGGETEIDLFETVNRLKTAQTEEETAEIVKSLAWYFNYDLPLADTYYYLSSFWADTESFSFPEKSNPVYYQKFGGYFKMLRRGLIKGVEK